MEPLRIFVGYDSKEPVAYHVLAHSILTRASCPVSIAPLVQSALRQQGTYTRERGSTESTEFSLTRFLVPHLCDYKGYGVFMDSDMLCRVDIAELYAWIAMELEESYLPATYPHRQGRIGRAKAVLCCQHDYTPSEATKFLGHVQTAYPKKNWSSFMVFANDACTALTPDYVNTASGLDLHRFTWTTEDRVAGLPLTWNWLVGEYRRAEEAKMVHFTLGGPWWPGYEDTDYADEWRAERDAALGQIVAA